MFGMEGDNCDAAFQGPKEILSSRQLHFYVSGVFYVSLWGCRVE